MVTKTKLRYARANNITLTLYNIVIDLYNRVYILAAKYVRYCILIHLKYNYIYTIHSHHTTHTQVGEVNIKIIHDKVLLHIMPHKRGMPSLTIFFGKIYFPTWVPLKNSDFVNIFQYHLCNVSIFWDWLEICLLITSW